MDFLLLIYFGGTQDFIIPSQLVDTSQKRESEKITMLSKNDSFWISGEYEEKQELQFVNPIFIQLKDHIYKISNQYGVPYDILTTIGHQESGGDWETNGMISYTGDYGQFQINLRWNFEDIHRDLGFTVEELLYDPYKNIEASAYLLKRIMNLYGYTIHNFNYENIFGTYNGWLNWRRSSISRQYVSSCMSIISQQKYLY